MYSLSNRLLLCACVLLGSLWSLPALADLSFAAQKIQWSAVTLQGVKAQVRAGTDANTLVLDLHADNADVSSLGWHHVGLKLDGTLRRDTQMRWMFDGIAQLANAPGGALSNAQVKMVIDASANTLELEALQSAAAITTAIPLDQPTHAQISLKNLPAAWLQGLLTAGEGGHVSGGKLDADLALDKRDGGIQSSGYISGAGLSLELAGNALGTQAVSGHGRFEIDATGQPLQWSFNGSLHDGQVHVSDFLAALPPHDVQLDIGAQAQRGAWNIHRLHVDDADALQLDGALATDSKGNLQKLRLDHVAARFPAAYTRYGQAWLDSQHWQNLTIAGQLEGHVDFETEGWRSFALHAVNLSVADFSGRFAANNLHGDMNWAAQGDIPTTTLEWNHLVFYGIPTGASVSRWHSHDGDLSLQSPIAIPAYGGKVDIHSGWIRPLATNGTKLSLAASLSAIDLADVSRSMGWAAVTGKISGTLPSIRWLDNRLAIDGDVLLETLGGAIHVTHLSLQQPFGNEPSVTGDLAIHQLDLSEVANAFNFGSISGHLSGSIDGLRLVSGTPVAFSASLRSDGGGRINQRAMTNLATLSGGSITGGLQGAMLHLFRTVNYNRIGLDCTLQNGICQMGGLNNRAGSYLLVEGSGLPSVDVAGQQTHIEWPVLLRRWRAITQTAAPDTR